MTSPEEYPPAPPLSSAGACTGDQNDRLTDQNDRKTLSGKWLLRMAELEDGCEIGAGILHPEAPHEAIVAAYMEQGERLAALRPLEKLLKCGMEFSKAEGIDGPILRHDEGYEAAKEYLKDDHCSVDYRDEQAIHFAKLVVSMYESSGWWGRFAAHLYKEVELLRREAEAARPILRWASQRPEGSA